MQSSPVQYAVLQSVMFYAVKLFDQGAVQCTAVQFSLHLNLVYLSSLSVEPSKGRLPLTEIERIEQCAKSWNWMNEKERIKQWAKSLI